MKNVLILIALVALCAESHAQTYLEMIERGTYTVSEIQAEAERYFEGRDLGRGSGYKQYKRWEHEALLEQDADGYLRTDQEDYQSILRRDRVLNQQLSARTDVCNGDWTELGPVEVDVAAGYNPGIGRVTAFSIDPTDPEHIIIGAQTGGVWRSMNGGASWMPLSDRFSNMQVYGLLIDPNDSNIYYWGGASGLFFISYDQGSTWEDRSITGGSFVVDIKWYEARRELWVATSWGGVYKSSDQGRSWTRLIDDRVLDVEFHPTDDSVLYAAGTHVWVSNDFGETFVEVEDDAFADPGGVFMLAVSDHAPDHVYALQELGRSFVGLYKSRDRGATFSILQDTTAPNYLGYDIEGDDDIGQAPRDMDIVVSDTDTSDLFIGGINIWRSLDNGRSFEIVSHWFYRDDMSTAYSHADIDIMQWRDGKLFIGSDGGFYVMDEPTGPIEPDAIRYISSGVGITQFYRIGIRQAEQVMVTGGTQDNGINLYNEGRWSHWMGADGMETFFFEGSVPVLYGATQRGRLWLSFDLGQSRTFVGATAIDELQGTGNWITPFMKDLSDESIFVAYDEVFRSVDGGQRFESISQPLSLSHMAIATTGADTIYGASGEELFRTIDGGATSWERLRLSSQGISSEVTAIAIHPRDARVVAIATRGDDRLYLTRDGGDTWSAYASGLPGFTVRTLVWQDDDRETLYAGMNYGIYRIDRTQSEWLPFDFGLPNVIINDLHINEVRQELYAGTYGRGLWVSPLCDPPVSNTSVDPGFDLRLSEQVIFAGTAVRFLTDERISCRITAHRSDGQMVYRDDQATLSDSYSIPTDRWSTGMHIIRVQHRQGYRTFKLIIK